MPDEPPLIPLRPTAEILADIRRLTYQADVLKGRAAEIKEQARRLHKTGQLLAEQKKREIVWINLRR